MGVVPDESLTIAVVGLGYVGLPLALELSKYYQVVGFDINKTRISDLQNSIDHTNEFDKDELKSATLGRSMKFTSDEKEIRDKSFYIITVPTPVNHRFEPDLSAVGEASKIVGRAIRRGATVIYESTVYPGATEEACIPIIEKYSGLRRSLDFFFGYSPERINPGDKNLSVADIVKVTSGCCAESAEKIDSLYKKIIRAGTHKAESIKVAETSKVFENVQRDVNIALMNEFSMLCHSLKIDTHKVLSAASTKWNFLNFSPGLVGGHCISIDPYYLIYRAQEVNSDVNIMLSARRVNERLPEFIVDKLREHYLQRKLSLSGSKVLVMGYTFKENCPDTRNTKVRRLVSLLEDLGVEVEIHDPWISEEDRKRIDFNFLENIVGRRYDAVMVCVNHRQYQNLALSKWQELLESGPIFFDLKGACKYFTPDFRL